MFIYIEDLTLSRCFLKEESQLGEGVVMWLGMNVVDPLCSDPAIPGKDAAEGNNQEIKDITIKKIYEIKINREAV